MTKYEQTILGHAAKTGGSFRASELPEYEVFSAGHQQAQMSPGGFALLNIDSGMRSLTDAGLIDFSVQQGAKVWSLTKKGQKLVNGPAA